MATVPILSDEAASTDARVPMVKGMTQEQHGELLAVIAIATQTNVLKTAMHVPVDKPFEL